MVQEYLIIWKLTIFNIRQSSKLYNTHHAWYNSAPILLVLIGLPENGHAALKVIKRRQNMSWQLRETNILLLCDWWWSWEVHAWSGTFLRPQQKSSCQEKLSQLYFVSFGDWVVNEAYIWPCTHPHWIRPLLNCHQNSLQTLCLTTQILVVKTRSI